jgi:hypothetical protein
MASRIFRKIMGLNYGEVRVSGSFAPNGSSALSATAVKGKGFTVAYISTGLYRITFADKYPTLISCRLGLQLTTGDDKVLQMGDYTAASKTLDIRCWDISAAAVADISANANNRIHFDCVFGNLSFT